MVFVVQGLRVWRSKDVSYSLDSLDEGYKGDYVGDD